MKNKPRIRHIDYDHWKLFPMKGEYLHLSDLQRRDQKKYFNRWMSLNYSPLGFRRFPASYHDLIRRACHEAFKAGADYEARMAIIENRDTEETEDE